MQAPSALLTHETNPFESLCQLVAAEPDIARAAETLLDGLAQVIRETSNDQNVQWLARRLRAHAPALVSSVVCTDASAMDASR